MYLPPIYINRAINMLISLKTNRVYKICLNENDSAEFHMDTYFFGMKQTNKPSKLIPNI